MINSGLTLILTILSIVREWTLQPFPAHFARLSPTILREVRLQRPSAPLHLAHRRLSSPSALREWSCLRSLARVVRYRLAILC